MNLYADLASLLFASIMSYITYNDCSMKSMNIPLTAPVSIESFSVMQAFDKLQKIKAQMDAMVYDRDENHHKVLLAAPEEQPWLLSTQT